MQHCLTLTSLPSRDHCFAAITSPDTASLVYLGIIIFTAIVAHVAVKYLF